MPLNYTQKDLEKKRQKYREELLKRLFKGHGDRQEIADMLGVSRETVWRGLTKPDGNFINVFEMLLIAESRGIPSGELAYGETVIRSDKEKAIIETLRRVPEADLSVITAMAEKLATPLPAQNEGDVSASESYEIPRASKRRNTRSDFPVFHIAKSEPRRITRIMPHFFELAAGPGREFEMCKEIYSFREHIPGRNVHAATIHGSSMCDTIRHGETILLQAFDEGKAMRLLSLETGQPKTDINVVRQFVRNQDICVLSINDEPPTLKRVNIFQRGQKWVMTILADNPETEDFPRPILSEDEVAFYAKMLGYVGREGD